MKKRLLSVLMALCLMLAMCITASAAALEGVTPAVTMTQNGSSGVYDTITAAINATKKYDFSTNKRQYVITLNADCTEDVTIPADRSIKIDLNGHTLTNVSGHTITNNSTRTYITDTSTGKTGVVDNVTHGKGAIYNNINANITLQGGTYTRSQEASTSSSNPGGNSWYVIKNFGTMTIQDGVTVKFSDSNNGVYSSLIGNGWQNCMSAESGSSEPKPSEGGKKATLTIRGGTFIGGQITIKNDDYGVLSISGGRFTQPSDNRYAVLNNNTATISGGTFNSKAAVVGSLHYDGGANTGDITIKGGTFTSESSNAISVGAGADLTLTSGTFSTGSNTAYVISLVSGANAEISGGSFPGANASNVVNSESAFKDGYGVVESADGSVSVGVTDANAQAVVIASDGTTTNYLTLSSAASNAPANSTIKLLKDVTLSSGVSTKNFGITLDLNGHSITGSGFDGAAISLKTNYGSSPVDGNSTMRLINSLPGDGGKITAKLPLSFDAGDSNKPVAGMIGDGVTLEVLEGGTDAVMLDSSAYLMYSEATAGYIKSGGFLITAADGERIYGSYANAVGQATDGKVTLMNNYTGSDKISSGSKTGTLDLGGNTYTYTGTDAIVDVNYDNAGMTITNGTLTTTNSVADGIHMLNSNSSLTLDGVTVTIPGTTYGIVTNGQETNNTLTLEGSTLDVVNGYGVYFPSTGSVTINNSIIKAKYVGVQMCAGSLSVTGERTAITVTGSPEDKAENDGVIGDGAAISIVKRDGYQALGDVRIEAGTFKASKDSCAVKAYEFNNDDKKENNWADANKTITVTGGTFQITDTDGNASKSDVSAYIPVGTSLNQDESGAVVTGSNAVAAVDGMPYDTLDSAITAANGKTVTLLKSIMLDNPISVGGMVVLDLAGYTITAPEGSYIAVVAESGDFTLNDSSAGGTGKLTGGTGDGAHAGAVTVQNGGAFTMNGGSITGNTGTTSGAGVSVGRSATFTMTGGSITNNTATVNLQSGVYANRQSTVTISGKVNISGNTGNDMGTTEASDLWLDTLNGAVLTIGDDGLDPEARVGIYVNGGVSDVKAFTSAYASGKASAENFTSNRSKYYVVEIDAEGGKAMAMTLFKAAAPTASLQSGTYVGPQTVSLSTTTYPNLTTIYYTSDGTDPRISETRQKYTQALTIKETTIIKAYTTGLSGDCLDSDVVTFTYTITSAPGKPNVPNTYDITVADSANGSVSTSLKNASEGSVITVTVDPDDGFVLGSLAVTGPNGSVDVTRVNSTTYRFTMPDGAVTVRATFSVEGIPFTDVSTGDWFYEAVSYVYANGLMDGVSETQFAPNRNLTRGMVVTILYRLEGEPRVTGSSGFSDVASGAWYADPVTWAAANGIVNGVSDTEFAPDTDITREQLAAILFRYAEYKGYDVSGRDSLTGYTDRSSISAYALDAMRWAVDEGLITGMTATTIVPQGTATRAQCATMLMRFIENIA